MKTAVEAKASIYAEITRENRAVRQEYIRHFSAEADEFAALMGQAMLYWLALHANSKSNEQREHVSAVVYTAISLHVGSMKLLLSGHTVAAGNMFRQVVETISLALLCSGKDMSFLERFERDKYSTHHAVRDVKKYAKQLGIKKDSLTALEHAKKFYDNYSHPSKFTIAVAQSFAGEGIYIGAAFDPGKTPYYGREASGRLQLAKHYPSLIQVVGRNLASW